MRTLPVVLVFVVGFGSGCGSKSSTPPITPATPPPVVAAPAPVTCADVGVILRSTVDDQKHAGPAKEAVIARACKLDKWSPEIIKCVGTEHVAKNCLDKLSKEQRASYDKNLVSWNELYPDEYLGENVEPPEQVDDYVDCSDAVKNVESYQPAVTLTGDDKDFVIARRKESINEVCDADWETEQRTCFRDAGPSGIDVCRAKLSSTQQKALTDKLAEIDKLAAKIIATKKTPASFECKQVVALHYADANWKGKMDATKGAERTKAITESRTMMTKACVDDKWTPNMRACIISGGGEACFTTTTVRFAMWGFPASGVFVKSGIPECDTYASTIKSVIACTTMPQTTRDSLKMSWQYMSTTWANATPDRKVYLASTCKQAEAAIRQMATGSGCKI